MTPSIFASHHVKFNIGKMVALRQLVFEYLGLIEPFFPARMADSLLRRGRTGTTCLAARLSTPPSYVAKVELGNRCIDVVELMTRVLLMPF